MSEEPAMPPEEEEEEPDVDPFDEILDPFEEDQLITIRASTTEIEIIMTQRLELVRELQVQRYHEDEAHMLKLTTELRQNTIDKAKELQEAEEKAAAAEKAKAK